MTGGLLASWREFNYQKKTAALLQTSSTDASHKDGRDAFASVDCKVGSLGPRKSRVDQRGCAAGGYEQGRSLGPRTSSQRKCGLTTGRDSVAGGHEQGRSLGPRTFTSQRKCELTIGRVAGGCERVY